MLKKKNAHALNWRLPSRGVAVSRSIKEAPLSAPEFTELISKTGAPDHIEVHAHGIFPPASINPSRNMMSLLLLTVLPAQASASAPPLQLHFYAQSCPRAEAIVRRVFQHHAAQDRSVLPALIRLAGGSAWQGPTSSYGYRPSLLLSTEVPPRNFHITVRILFSYFNWDCVFLMWC